jgi:hypothetical protein
VLKIGWPLKNFIAKKTDQNGAEKKKCILGYKQLDRLGRPVIMYAFMEAQPPA